MNPKKMLPKEISAKFKDQISEQTITETLDQFFKHGNTFLLLNYRVKDRKSKVREKSFNFRKTANEALSTHPLSHEAL